jgi:hypothetical protein
LRAIGEGQSYFYLSLPAGTGEYGLVAALARELRSRGRILIVALDYEVAHQLAAVRKVRRRGSKAGRIAILSGGADDDVTASILIGSIHTLTEVVALEAEPGIVRRRRPLEPIGAVIDRPTAAEEITDRQWSFLERHAPAQLAEIVTVADADAEISRVIAGWQAPVVRRALWGDALRELWLAARETGGEVT